ncbi:hypothetical protein PInf_014600 [Phytophthora infestans]|nr:hypothetical protein PInf_014600 [Phytophthora infestans]
MSKEDDDIDIVSSPQPRGRSKEKPKIVAIMLNDAMSFESAGSVLMKFKFFVVSKKTKAPVAHIGVLDTATPPVMKSYHRARAAILVVEIAVKWLGTIDFTHQRGPDFVIDSDAVMHMKIWDLRLLSSEVLDLAAKGRLSDVTMSTVLNKLLGPSPDVIVVSPHAITVSMNTGHMQVNTLKASFFGASAERVLIPIDCNPSHWCAILINLAAGEVKCYDPMQSTYKVGVRAKAEQLIALLPDRAGRYHVGFYDADFCIQTDSYNCGIYVPLASEVFSGATSPGLVGNQKLRAAKVTSVNSIGISWLAALLYCK